MLNLKKFIAGILVALPLATMAGKAEAVPIPVELMLAIDGSGSIGGAEFTLQRDAYISVLGSALISTTGEIAIGVVQFGSESPDFSIPVISTVHALTVIDSAAKKAALIASLTGMTQIGGNTPIAAAIAAAQAALTGLDHANGNEIIDVSTDGMGNIGNEDTAADAAIAAGVEQVNCIGIGGGADCGFIAGAGAFSIAAADFAAFEAGLRNKIAQEVGEIPEPATLGILGFGLAGFAFMRRRRKTA